MPNLVRSRQTGRYAISTTPGEQVRAFIPTPLPPGPPLRLEPHLALLEQANRALGRLDGMSATLPNPKLFVYMYVRKEAVLSAQIEGTQSSLADLLRVGVDDASDASPDDVLETSLYVNAMEHGMTQLEQGMPLSNRLLREVHAKLLAKGRGSDKQPGEFRDTQNWVGGTRPGTARYVPPPVNEVMQCMSDLEKFIHQRSPAMPLLIKAALAHVQFETIHPFLDGNGRLGRLLITFLLHAEGALQQPILYLSLFLKNRRDEYYDWLQCVRERGDWEGWIEFFLTGITETSEQAAESVQRILKLFDNDRERLRQASASTLRVHEHLQSNPLIVIPATAKVLGLSAPTVRTAVGHLVDLNIVKEISGRQRRQVFAYSQYLSILAEGTEPL